MSTIATEVRFVPVTLTDVANVVASLKSALDFLEDDDYAETVATLQRFERLLDGTWVVPS